MRPKHASTVHRMTLLLMKDNNINTAQKVKLSYNQLKTALSFPVDGYSHSFNRRFNLKRHIKSFHGDQYVASPSAGRFVCHFQSGGEQFYHESKMIQHYKMKHGTHIIESDHCIHHNATTTHDCTCTEGTGTKKFPS